MIVGVGAFFLYFFFHFDMFLRLLLAFWDIFMKIWVFIIKIRIRFNLLLRKFMGCVQGKT
jgi:hypothetical protein